MENLNHERTIIMSPHVLTTQFQRPAALLVLLLQQSIHFPCPPATFSGKAQISFHP